jgi:hypothetical protein
MSDINQEAKTAADQIVAGLNHVDNHNLNQQLSSIDAHIKTLAGNDQGFDKKTYFDAVEHNLIDRGVLPQFVDEWYTENEGRFVRNLIRANDDHAILDSDLKQTADKINRTVDGKEASDQAYTPTDQFGVNLLSAYEPKIKGWSSFHGVRPSDLHEWKDTGNEARIASLASKYFGSKDAFEAVSGREDLMNSTDIDRYVKAQTAHLQQVRAQDQPVEQEKLEAAKWLLENAVSWRTPLDDSWPKGGRNPFYGVMRTGLDKYVQKHPLPEFKSAFDSNK